MLEQRDLEFFCEETFRQTLTFLIQSRGLEFVAGGLDDLDLENEPRKRFAALIINGVGLRKSEGAPACGDDKRAFWHFRNGRKPAG